MQPYIEASAGEPFKKMKKAPRFQRDVNLRPLQSKKCGAPSGLVGQRLISISAEGTPEEILERMVEALEARRPEA